MALATLSIDIVAKLAGLEQGVDKANRILAKQAADIERRNSSLQASAIALGKVLGSAFAGISLAAFTKQTIDGLDALNDLRDATGASIENLSGLEDVAVRTGTSFETAGSALIKFNKELTDAKPGTETAQIFKALGLSAEELKKIDPAEALTKTAVALAQFADDGNKARIVQALFGKSVGEVAPLLKDLADQGKLVATVTTKQAQAAEDFNKQLFNIQKNATDAARVLLSDLLPAINQVLEGISKTGGLSATISANAGFDLIGFDRKELERLNLEITDTARRLEAFVEAQQKNPFDPSYGKQVELLRTKLEGLQKQALVSSSALKAFANQVAPLSSDFENFTNEGPARGRSPKPSAPDVPDKVKTAKASKASQVDPLLKSVQERIDALPAAKIAALTKELQALISLRTTKNADSFDEAIRNIRDELERFNPEAELAKANAARLKELLADTGSSKIAAANADLELLRANLTETGDLTQYIEAVRARFNLTDEAIKSVDEFSVFAEQAGRNIQDALGSGVKSFLSGEYKSISGLFKNLIVDLTSQAISAQLGKALLGDFGKTGKVGGLLGAGFDFIGSLFNANGNAFDANGRITAFAGGGVFDRPTGFTYGAGQLGVLGEAGPEAVMPLRRGPGGKLGVVAQGGGGSSTVINNISVGAGVTRGEVVALLQSYGSSLKAEILASQRNGGAFSR